MDVKELKEIVWKRIGTDPRVIFAEHDMPYRTAMEFSALLARKGDALITVQRVTDIAHGMLAGLVLADAEKNDEG